MKNKSKACPREPKNHQGNYEISVSFDLYGKSPVMEGDAYVELLDQHLRNAFEVFADHKYFKLKNVKWNK